MSGNETRNGDDEIQEMVNSGEGQDQANHQFSGFEAGEKPDPAVTAAIIAKALYQSPPDPRSLARSSGTKALTSPQADFACATVPKYCTVFVTPGYVKVYGRGLGIPEIPTEVMPSPTPSVIATETPRARCGTMLLTKNGASDTERIPKPQTVLKNRVREVAPAEGIIKLMACSFCDNIERLMPFICNEGHFACEDCVMGKPIEDWKCPFQNGDRACGAGYIEAKCALLQYLLDNSRFQCPNSDLGCSESRPVSQLSEHGKICPWGPSLKCPYPKCMVETENENGLVLPILFVRHLEEHNVPMGEGSLVRIRTNVNHVTESRQNVKMDRRWVGQVVKCSDFYFYVGFRATNQSIFVWIAHMCDPGLSEQNPFDARLCIRAEKGMLSMTWEGEIQDRDKPFHNIALDAECICLPQTALHKKYTYRNQFGVFFNTDVKITKKKQIVTEAGDSETKLSIPQPFGPLNPMPKLSEANNQSLK